MLLTIVITGKSVHMLLKQRNNKSILSKTKDINALSECLKEILKSATTKGWKIAKPISTALILPNSDKDLSFKINSFKKEFSNDIRIVFEDRMGISYLKGSGKSLKDSSYILLYNFGEGSELYTMNSNGTSSVAELKELNLNNGHKKLHDHMIAEFSKEGLVVGKDEEDQLMKEILNNGKGGKYEVHKKSDNISIQATINISKNEYEDLISDKRTILNQHLHPKILQSNKNLKEVILIGSLFDNNVLQNYLKKDLQIGNKLSTDGLSDIDKVVDKISSVGFGGIEKFLEAERQENERISQLKARREAMHARESLLLDIRQTCTDPAKEEEYKRTFIKKADNLNIPREVVLWNITEIMDTIRLEKELEKKSDLPVISSLDLESNTIQSAQKSSTKIEVINDEPKAPKVNTSISVPPKPKAPPAKKIEPVKVKTDKNIEKPGAAAVAEKTKTATLSISKQVEKIFKPTKKIADIGFHAQYGNLLNESGDKIFRYISKDELKDKNKASQFEKIFNKESLYYEKTSPIHNASFGKYYYRDVLEGETINVFLKKNASRFKSDIEKWSNNDLKLILKIWKEIENIDYSFRLKPENIVVISKLTWSLKREQEAKLTLFNAKESSKTEMEKDMHDILTRLLGKRTYQNLRKKFSV